MTTIREMTRRLFKIEKPLPQGIYSYQTPPDAGYQYRLHLRIEPDGSGILIVNASTVLHLNQTAAEFAYHFIIGTDQKQVAEEVSHRYHVRREQAEADYQDFIQRIQTMINTPDLDPEAYLDFERQAPYTGDLSAPYRLDCALTYRLDPNSPAEAAPVDRVKRELNTDEWKAILDKAWEAGVPHVIFTGGEPTLREDLFDLLRYCQDKGMVSGLLTDGLRAANPAYLNFLLQPDVGLDHLMMIFQPDLELAWTALKNLTEADLFVAVHLTLTPEKIDGAPALLERLSGLGVKAISLSGSGNKVNDTLADLRNQAASLGLSLVWDLPVPYSAQHPVALELQKDDSSAAPQGAGRAWLYVEPDGDVLAGQGYPTVLGNLLNDPWVKVWSAAKAARPQA